MAYIIRVNISTRQISKCVQDEYKLLGGRALSSRIVSDQVDPACDPLGEHNKLVIAPGLLAGTTASSAGRISVGAKSPLTGGIKEANCGGNSGVYLGRIGVKAIVIEGRPADESAYVLKVSKENICLLILNELRGLGTYDTSRKLQEKFGEKIAVLCIGPAGERCLRSAAVASTDPNGELKFAARGGLGAVMGSKGIKAVVIENPGSQLVPYWDKEAFLQASKKYNSELTADPKTKEIFQKVGTNGIFKAVNAMGALPTRNFSSGSFEFAENLSGEKMYETILARGGEGKTGVSCMSGCIIKCSNIYPDATGKKICSTLQYENVALLGSNCCLDNLDSVARLNHICNDFGVDAIEIGATIGIALEMGLAEFGDEQGCLKLLQEIANNTTLGRILGNGAYLTGQVFDCRRVPVAKGQAFPGYDPRALKGNGVTYAVSPMGADHTAGNCFGSRGEVNPLGVDRQGDLSRTLQIKMTTLDSLGFCIFARNPIFKEPTLISAMVNALLGAGLTPEDVWNMGKDTLRVEREFNVRAGLSPCSDRLPEFVYKEKLAPTGEVFDLQNNEMEKALV